MVIQKMVIEVSLLSPSISDQRAKTIPNEGTDLGENK